MSENLLEIAKTTEEINHSQISISTKPMNLTLKFHKLQIY